MAHIKPTSLPLTIIITVNKLILFPYAMLWGPICKDKSDFIEEWRKGIMTSISHSAQLRQRSLGETEHNPNVTYLFLF
jgi:hypothetical protein